MIITWLLYTSLVLYSIIDAVQTKMLISLGATEANPLLAWIIQETGTVNSIFAVKIFWLTLLFAMLWKFGKNKTNFR